MTSSPATPPEAPAEPEDAPERRIRRGCLWIIVLLLIGGAVNFAQYGLNIVTIVMGALLAVALVALILVSRERGARR